MSRDVAIFTQFSKVIKMAERPLHRVLVLLCLSIVPCVGGMAGCAQETPPTDWNDVVDQDRDRGDAEDSKDKNPIDAALEREICTDGPLTEPLRHCTPGVLPSTGDDGEDCVQRINQLRAECQCLPRLKRWVEGESCAEEHAAYDAQFETPHAGFREQVCDHGGFAQNECPGWDGGWVQINRDCLQMMWDEGPGEDFMEHGHYINMSNQNYTEVACGGADGWYVHNFR